MSTALYALLDSIIDYAGLFPPAQLSMRDAVTEYWRHCRGPEKWMVSRFVCPANRLDEFADVLANDPSNDPQVPIPISVIGTKPTRQLDLALSVEEDGGLIAGFIEKAQGRCSVEAYEVRKPEEGSLKSTIGKLLVYHELDVFLELPWDDNLLEDLHAIAELDWIGAKVRTGGESRDQFPSARDLARFMHECLSLDLRFKLTAGMHHPLRHRDELIGAHQHGFLNVAIAAALAEEYDFTREEIESVLLDESPSSFVFGPDTMYYRDLEIDAPAIEDMRSLFVSYGSCSVDDPILGLAKMGLVQVNRA